MFKGRPKAVSPLRFATAVQNTLARGLRGVVDQVALVAGLARAEVLKAGLVCYIFLFSHIEAKAVLSVKAPEGWRSPRRWRVGGRRR
jgi:hypothetical protein